METGSERMTASVALANATGAYDKLYDYLVPAGMALEAGMRVIVPFGRTDKPCEAWITAVVAAPAAPPSVAGGRRLKTIREQVDVKPLLQGDLLKIAEWMRTRFFCTWHQAISAMLPSGVKLKVERSFKLKAAPTADPAAESISAAKPSDEAESPCATESFDAAESPCATESFDVAESPCATNRSDAAESSEAQLLAMLSDSEGVAETVLAAEYPELLELARKWVREGFALLDVSYAQRSGAKTERAAVALIGQEALEQLIESHSFRSQPQLLAMETLMESERVAVSELYQLPGVNGATLRALEKKGLISFQLTTSERDPFKDLAVRESLPMPLTLEQAAAAEQIRSLMAEIPVAGEQTAGGRLAEALVLGVTGSGKTELYLNLIQGVLEKNRTAIVLVPEIALTPQMAERFIGRFGQRVAIQHSRLSTGERLDQWTRIRNGELTVVIGARSAIFAPVVDLGIIIIDEEHEPAYRSETTPRYDARLVARARAGISGAALVYGSATPSLETYQRARNGEIALIEMKNRVQDRPMPSVLIVDMKQELQGGNRSIFSAILSERLRETVTAGEQAILFLNRRGFASCLLCRDCGHVMKCPSCDLPLTIHRSGRAICHYCGFLAPVPDTCPSCGGKRMKAFGAGTQRIEADLGQQTQGYRVLRMDLDTTSGKNGHRRLLDLFRSRQADILVGTQMVAKGHDFPDVTLVGILAADAVLYNGDFRAAERTFQLVTQAAGRAGRAEKPGFVIIQAYNPDEYVLRTAVHHDFTGFAEHELALRRKLFYPPWCHIGMVRLQSESEENVQRLALDVDRILQEEISKQAQPEAFVRSSPGRAPMPLLGGRHRWRILVRHVSAVRLCRLLEAVQRRSFSGCSGADVDLNVEVDPVSMV